MPTLPILRADITPVLLTMTMEVSLDDHCMLSD